MISTGTQTFNQAHFFRDLPRIKSLFRSFNEIMVIRSTAEERPPLPKTESNGD